VTLGASVRPVPYPASVKAKGWRFEVDLEALKQSETWAMAEEIPLAQHCALMAWLRSWEQTPCGSMPSDDGAFRALARIPMSLWPTVRDVVLRGWWLAEDGRLYHDTLTKRVQEMMYARAAFGHLKHWDEVIARDGERCVYCRISVATTLDHITPRSRGGTHDPSNLTPSCRPCNSSKGARTPDEWRAAQ
jgi:hypothetical protein